MITNRGHSLTNRLAESFLHVWRIWHRASHPIHKDGITPSQYWLLSRLRNSGPSRVSDLACSLGVTNSSATIAAKRLEKQGLVSRTRDRHDERVVLVDLTVAGRAMLTSWHKEQREKLSSLMSSLDDGEQRQLLRLLEKLSSSERSS